MLMIVGAGPMQLPAISIAREMGLQTLVTDYNPEAPGLAQADISEIMSTKDIEGSVRVARHYRHQLKGVLTVGTDASLTVAAIAGALGLPGIHYDAAENATHKLKMRRALQKAGVPIPEFGSAWTIDEAREVADRIGYPVVVKPVDNMGSRGVVKVLGPSKVEDGFRHAISASTSGEVLVEEFMEGPELSIDALVVDGEIICTGIADRIIGLPPYFIELGHTIPSRMSDEDTTRAVAAMSAAVKALQITNGAAKGDIKMTPDGPKIGECAARLSGGWMSSHTYPYSAGYSMVRGAIEIALGREPQIPEPLRRVSVERALIAAPGKVTRIDGLANAKKIPGVRDVILKCQVGDLVTKPTSNMDKQVHIIAVGNTFEEAENSAKRALDAIIIETKMDTSVSLSSIGAKAKSLFGKYCAACRVCDGVYCAGMVPGMGGIGTGQSFMNNLRALAKYQLVQKVIHDIDRPSLSTTFLGMEFSLPVIAAPITGAVTNMGGAITEDEYAQIVVSSSAAAGTIACVGDGATPGKYRIGLDAALKERGHAIPVFKPRSQEEVLQRVREAVAVGCPAIGIDVDGAAFVTMRSKGQSVSAKSVDQLRSIIDEVDVPFLIKGVMSEYDAEAAVRAGASAIIVSNHGGRVMDHMPGAADVLAGIISAIRGDVLVVLDGGIRTGEDVLKGMALGADLCMIGRPIAIAAVGGGDEGVSLYWQDMKDQLERAMILTGTESIKNVTEEILMSASHQNPTVRRVLRVIKS